ncbi:MAG: hypothetical protein IPQ12_10580 [Polaromonas sp.]|nr:hypothetical protein [Polaromonas sp.]
MVLVVAIAVVFVLTCATQLTLTETGTPNTLLVVQAAHAEFPAKPVSKTMPAIVIFVGKNDDFFIGYSVNSLKLNSYKMK